MASGIPVDVTVVFGEENCAEIEAVAQLCAEIGVRTVSFSLLKSRGRAKDNRIAPPSQSEDELVQQIQQLGEKYRSKIRIKREISIDDRLLESGRRGILQRDCRRVVNGVAVEADGTLYLPWWFSFDDDECEPHLRKKPVAKFTRETSSLVL